VDNTPVDGKLEDSLAAAQEASSHSTKRGGERAIFPVAQDFLELVFLGMSLQGHGELIDRLLRDSRDLVESKQGQALDTLRSEGDNAGRLLGNYIGGTPRGHASESERTASRSVLVIKVGEVEEDVVAHAAEELDVGGHVEFNSLLV
jgi:hypothetical protein